MNNLHTVLFNALRCYPTSGKATHKTLADLNNVLGQLDDMLYWFIESVANLLAANADSDNPVAKEDVSRVAYVVAHLAELAQAITPLLDEVKEDLEALAGSEGQTAKPRDD